MNGLEIPGVTLKDIKGIDFRKFSIPNLNFQSVVARTNKKGIEKIKMSISGLLSKNLQKGDRDYLRSVVKNTVGYEVEGKNNEVVTQSELESKMKELESRINDEITEIEARIEARFEKRSKEVDSILEELEKREKAKKEAEIDAILAEIDKKNSAKQRTQIDDILTQLKSKIDSPSKIEVDAIISDIEEKKEAKIDAILAEIDEKNNDEQEIVVAPTDIEAKKEEQAEVEPKEENDKTEKDASNSVEQPKSLLEKLSKINEEGRIFSDEDRILDKTLNVYNAKSTKKHYYYGDLTKIKQEELTKLEQETRKTGLLRKLSDINNGGQIFSDNENNVVDQELQVETPQQVNVSNNVASEVKPSLFQKFKQKCTTWFHENVVSRIPSCITKSGLICEEGKVHDVDIEASTIEIVSPTEFKVLCDGDNIEYELQQPSQKSA